MPAPMMVIRAAIQTARRPWRSGSEAIPGETGGTAHSFLWGLAGHREGRSPDAARSDPGSGRRPWAVRSRPARTDNRAGPIRQPRWAGSDGSGRVFEEVSRVMRPAGFEPATKGFKAPPRFRRAW